jgi:hypothetical protein
MSNAKPSYVDLHAVLSVEIYILVKHSDAEPEPHDATSFWWSKQPLQYYLPETEPCQNDVAQQR